MLGADVQASMGGISFKRQSSPLALYLGNKFESGILIDNVGLEEHGPGIP